MAWLAVAVVVLPGAALALALGRRLDAACAVVASVTVGMVAMIVWFALADLVGIRWSATSLLVPAVVAIVVLSIRRAAIVPITREGGGWLAAALALAVAHAWILSRIPAFGWDFRYIWGLKARVFAAAGGHAWGWLAWPPNTFAHPTYPPLWPDLLAIGPMLGASAGQTAAAWNAVLVVALAAACWTASAGAPPPLRFAAAIVGALAPVIFTRTVQHSGYAEPLLAVLAAAALAWLAALGEGKGPVAPLAVVTVALALAKNEGLALAVAVAVAALLSVRGHSKFAVPGAVALTAGWWLASLAAHRVSDQHLNLDPIRAVGRVAAMPGAVASSASAEVIVLGIAWVAALFALRGPALRGVRTALTLFAVAVIAAYATSTDGLAWQLGVTLSRVLAAPLPGVVALAIGASWRRGPTEQEPA